ncbi:alpha-mannosidase [Sansalvadorimonas sp. 2012CJ34-2]|uniref:Alpha-mannosidase n=1 Tax=Parendozoicomonas callyspongiae TaxID=2942213 RepID=A0ABT0PIE5_9GAMM|nr:alpha-mannosidase [Sansalvadorimonas sp. 2012CJ34-2]MCL6270791.1 alpha-mannosidase [Sansalvadorimonas sp. 2012CJ34-2]
MPTEFFHQQRLQRLVDELEEFRYRDRRSLGLFRCYEDNGEVGNKHPDLEAATGTMAVGDRWVGRDKYLWLTQTISLPGEWRERKVVGLFDFGRTGEGTNSGFEAMLYLNGHPWQGVDSNHKEVVFTPKRTGLELKLEFRLWSGLEGGGAPKVQRHELLQAEVACLEPSCDDLYFTARTALHTIDHLPEHSVEKSRLLNVLIQTFNQVDFSDPESEEFFDSVAEAGGYLEQQLKKMKQKHPVSVTCVGHTHIDIAWLWRLRHTREKAARSFATVNRLMTLYKDYTFLQSQPQLYEYIKKDYPVIYRRIQKWVKEGRWEAGGAMWVEADCNVSSGESLVRQLMYGIRFFEQEFGVRNNYLWLPDVFGYSWALPQILKQCGLETFFTTKISWNEYNKLPHDTFIWRGIDGSEVTTHFITTPTDEGPNRSYYTYNGLLEPHTVNGIWENYADKGINQNLLLAYGYGDGGGGVNRHMLEMRRRLEKMPGQVEVRSGRVDNFANKLNETIRSDHGGYLHTWDGELYLEYHRGTYTSQAYNKRMNRFLELKYRESEFLCALAAVQDHSWESYPEDFLYEGWKIILRNQFHDIIPGSSIREVYQDCREEYQQADLLADQCQQDALGALVSPRNNVYSIFNSAGWKRDSIVSLPVSDFRGSVCNRSGEFLPIQAEEDHLLVQVEHAPSLGAAQLYLKSDMYWENSPFDITDRTIQTPFYVLNWNEQGQVNRLYDLEAEREVLADGELANVFQVFEDKPRQYDAWEMEASFEQKQETVSELVIAEVISRGGLQISVQFQWRYRNSVITQVMTLYRSSRRIDFKTDVDWQEREKLVKVSFPVAIRASDATYDIQFGNVKRPTHKNTSWDQARFEVVGHQWADLSEQGYGVALLNNSKYGYDIHNHVMRLTLLKSSNYPDPLADCGSHEFTYALMPHVGSWQEVGVVQEAWDLNNPLQAQAGESWLAGKSLLRCDNTNIFIEAVKKAEDSDHLIVRLYEYAGSRGRFTLESDLRIESWQPCNLLEQEVGDEHYCPEISDEITPYQLKTYRVAIAR